MEREESRNLFSKTINLLRVPSCLRAFVVKNSEERLPVRFVRTLVERACAEAEQTRAEAERAWAEAEGAR